MRGGYVLAQTGAPQAVLLATGSEVALAMETAQILVNENIFLRVVSMPCVTRFEAQDGAYRASVLPLGLPIITLEAGATAAWRAYAGRDRRHRPRPLRRIRPRQGAARSLRFHPYLCCRANSRATGPPSQREELTRCP